MTFDEIYWASQPPAIQALPSITDPGQRAEKASELAAQGFAIDVPIMLWGWSPLLTMQYRQQYGYTWVPSVLQSPVTVAPGIGLPGAVLYDPNNAPKGSIKVSTNPADFPSWVAATPPVPAVAPITGPVGVLSIGDLYQDNPPNSYKNGDTFTDPRGTFRKYIVETPFGNSIYWKKIS